MAKDFCVRCDMCTGGCGTKINANMHYLITLVFTAGLYYLWYKFALTNCPKCDHKMIYHRAQPSYWLKHQKKRR